MKGLALYIGGVFSEDRIFDSKSPLNRDDCMAHYRALRSKMQEAGWETHTHDYWQKNVGAPDAVLFLDYPRGGVSWALGAWNGKAAPYLLIQECEVICPRNWDLESHKHFKRVFTWHPELLKNPLYKRACFSVRVTPGEVDGWDKRPNFCCLIAANKRAQHRHELYSQRVKSIRWFEQNHPEQFNLYGIDWNRLSLPGPKLLQKAFARMPLLPKLLAPRFPSYRGPIKNKSECLKSHRFSICFENAQQIPGYITEKIYDCFMAGCVPVYWGPPDIESYIPSDCFVDFRSFSGFDDMYAYLHTIDEARYRRYQQAMKDFLHSDKIVPFSAEYFATQISTAITGQEGAAEQTAGIERLSVRSLTQR